MTLGDMVRYMPRREMKLIARADVYKQGATMVLYCTGALLLPVC